MKVFIVQFLKAKASTEFIPLAKLSDSIVFVRYGRDCLIKGKTN